MAQQSCDYFGGIDPLVPRAIFRAGFAVADQALTPRRECERREICNDYLVKADLGYIMGCAFLLTAERLVTVLLQRSLSQGMFGDGDIRRFRNLVPHLVRAVRIQDAISERDWKSIALRSALDSLPFGVVLLTNDLRVLEANDSAIRLIGQVSGIDIVRQKLSVAPGSATGLLKHGIGDLCGRIRAGHSAEPHFFRIPGASGTVRLAVLPITVRLNAPPDAPRPTLVLALFAATTRARATPAALMRAFTLTKREAEVTLKIVEGQTVREIANHFRLADSTARGHVKRIMQKLGAHRQSDVVRMILTAPLAPWDSVLSSLREDGPEGPSRCGVAAAFTGGSFPGT